MPASARVGVRFTFVTALVPIPIAPVFSPTVSFGARMSSSLPFPVDGKSHTRRGLYAAVRGAGSKHVRFSAARSGESGRACSPRRGSSRGCAPISHAGAWPRPSSCVAGSSSISYSSRPQNGPPKSVDAYARDWHREQRQTGEATADWFSLVQHQRRSTAPSAACCC